MIIRALSVDVYRPAFGDCTNHGVSYRFDKLLIPCAEGPITIDTSKGVPENFCHVCFTTLGDEVYYRVVPDIVNDDTEDRGGRWYMMGGNFAYTTDARFSEMFGRRPIAIHDRVE